MTSHPPRAHLTMMMRTYLLVHLSHQNLLQYLLDQIFAHFYLKILRRILAAAVGLLPFLAAAVGLLPFLAAAVGLLPFCPLRGQRGWLPNSRYLLGHLMRASSTSPFPMKGMLSPLYHQFFSQILYLHLSITLRFRTHLGELFLFWYSSSSNGVSKHLLYLRVRRRWKLTGRAILTMLMTIRQFGRVVARSTRGGDS